MANKFDSANYPSREPLELVIGDRWAWKRADLGADYDPASYSLSYSARLETSAATEISISAGESGSEYVIEVASATTAAYTAGRYKWQAYITRDSDSARVTVDEGYFEAIVNRDAYTSDQRTHAQKTLDLIEAAIIAINFGAKSYSIGNRVMTYRDLSELETMRSKYRAEVLQERRAANGLGGVKLVARL